MLFGWTLLGAAIGFGMQRKTAGDVSSAEVQLGHSG